MQSTSPAASSTSPLPASAQASSPSYDDGLWNPTKYDHAAAALITPHARSAEAEPSTLLVFQQNAATTSAPAVQVAGSGAKSLEPFVYPVIAMVLGMAMI